MATRKPASASSAPEPTRDSRRKSFRLTLKVSATRPGGASVNMTRGVEVALIPVFQFGVFSDSDLSYFAGPNFNFAGPGAHQWQPVPGRGQRQQRSFSMTRLPR